ncbi:MAG: ADP-ribosylglycohydrolase family protein [Rhodospirillales bacterium]|nr:ADP-ribosylglycohydrolase family protein [Rhodospirillales bacterium]
MMGALAGDMIGAPYEGRDPPEGDFPLFGPGSVFTDDSVLSVAVAEALMETQDFAAALKRWARRYPDAGYGPRFKDWAFGRSASAPASWGNGAAMRVAPVGWAADSEDEALEGARASARPSHDHPDALAGAEGVALAIVLARRGETPDAIRAALAARFGWTLPAALDRIPTSKGFDTAARTTVPPAVACALAGADWEQAVRAAVRLGADADTQGAIAGAVAEARFGLPDAVARDVRRCLDRPLLAVVDRFAAWLKRRRR